MKPVSEPLAEQTALALLTLLPALGRIAEDATRAAAGAVSTVQASYLAELLGRPLRGVQLAERLRTTRASVAEVLQRLEAAGLVRSISDPSDGRARLTEATPAGRAALERFGRVTTEAVAEVVGQLPSQKLRALRDAARALAPLLSDRAEEVTP
jgi:DNA-binding MarR family transcriptional regulator